MANNLLEATLKQRRLRSDVRCERIMNKSDHVLAVFADNDGQVFVHADAKGLDVFIKSLQRLRKKIDEDKCDHDHLMTEAWAGDGELTEAPGCEKEGHAVHHIKLYGWTDEWAKKHGFIEETPNQ